MKRIMVDAALVAIGAYLWLPGMAIGKDAQVDREFLRYRVMHHEKDTAAFALQAKEGQDSDLKAFAAKQLPVLKEYLQQARDLAAQQHATGKGGQTTERRSTRQGM